MTLILTALAIWVATGILCLAIARQSRLAQILGPAGVVLGSLPATLAVCKTLLGGSSTSLIWPWAIPGASFSIGLDALSAFFVLPIVLICALAAIYGRAYLKSCASRKALGVPWAMFNLLAASMLMVIVARNAILFLFAWEGMSLTSFFLVLFESEHGRVRRAGWTYLVATHIGTAFLLVMFVLFGRASGSLDFDGFSRLSSMPALANLAFVLALIGFGTKAGFMPLHIWLPEAHPAAPSHVSAVMSGVMIKTGLYGLIRTLLWLGAPPLWWGYTLVVVGACSGVLGVMFVIVQHDLKRMLAYSSVENMGILGLGFGVGLIGLGNHQPLVAALGFSGALLHVLNHAIFKSLLFMGAGSVLHATGTREIDRLGGLLKRMPVTGATFLMGAVSISGLPPFNGFVGEFLIYFAAFSLLGASSIPVIIAALTVIVSLAVIGGLAAACFTNAFGIVFLGEPRSDAARHAHESGIEMRAPMIVLAGCCLMIALTAPHVMMLFAPVVSQLTRGVNPGDWMPVVTRSLSILSYLALGLLALIACLVGVRWALLSKRPVDATVTWDCGYIAPTSRMQYTGSSFVDPFVRFFGRLLGTRRTFLPPRGYFPDSASLSTHTPDSSREHVYRPVFHAIEQTLSKIQWLQHGHLNLYILYIALTLLALMAWKLGAG